MQIGVPMTHDEYRRYKEFIRRNRLRAGWYLHDLIMEEVEQWERKQQNRAEPKTSLNPEFAHDTE